MSAMHVKKGDTVKIIAGNEKPRKVKGEKVVKTGTVTSVDMDSSTVVVENVNMGYKHKKAKNAKDTGGRIQLAMPLHSSNVMVVCPACNMPTRVNYKTVESEGKEGKKLKVRICKKCGAAMDKKVESVKAKKDKKEKEKAEKKAKKEKDKKEKAEKKGKKTTEDKAEE